ncbi:MAG: alpha/beta fold hydrolase [Pseudobdellovibrionaceae bacterium]
MAAPQLIPKRIGVIQSFDETPIYYEIRGQGEPIVFVYGIACLINHWQLQIDFLSQYYTTVAFDLRGHQLSQPVNRKNLSVPDLAQDIQILLRELKIKKAHFLGHSFGTPIMLQLYRQAPELFLSITSINGFAKNPIKNMFGVNVVEPLFRGIQALYTSQPALFRQFWSASVNNPAAMLVAGLLGGFNLKLSAFKDIEIYAQSVSNMDLGVFIRLFESLMEFDGSDILAEIQVPSLVIAGGKDNITPLAFQHHFREMIAGSEYVELAYGSHCTQLDFPDYINLKIAEFIERSMFRK